jgi:hypothetical protein
MPEATVAADLDESFDAEIYLFPEITLYHVSFVYSLPDAVYLIVGKITNLSIWVDPCFFQDLMAQGRSNAIDAAQRDFHPLIPGYVNTCNPRHLTPPKKD